MVEIVRLLVQVVALATLFLFARSPGNVDRPGSSASKGKTPLI
jgi:hypothetical protein